MIAFDKIRKAYYRLFYWQYQRKANEHKDDNKAETYMDVYGAVLVVSIIDLGNLYTMLYILCKLIFGTPLCYPYSTHIAIAISVFLLNAFLFYRKGRYKRIAEMFQGESEEIRKRRNVVCEVLLFYSVLSLPIWMYIFR